MGIPKCNQCKTQLTWRQIYPTLWSGYKNVTCKICNTELEMVPSARGMISLLIVVPTVFLGMTLSSYMDLNTIQFFLLLTAISVSVTLFIPFIVKYNKAPDQGA